MLIFTRQTISQHRVWLLKQPQQFPGVKHKNLKQRRFGFTAGPAHVFVTEITWINTQLFETAGAMYKHPIVNNFEM